MLIPISGVAVHARAPSLLFPQNPTFTLFPPTDLTVTNIDCSCAYLRWNKPKNTGGTTPLGLIGYRIYCNGDLINYVSEPDTLHYFDYIDIYGTYKDSVTAYYDLTVYGYPGQFGESTGSTLTYEFDCSATMPFFEPWDNDSFTYQNWSFLPSQGNWMMNSYYGNPLPAASFTGMPALTDYDNTLLSVPLNCSAYTCANVYLEFDSRVIVNNPTSQEKLITELYYNSTWYSMDTLVNGSSTGWVHHKIDISEAGLEEPRIGFRATGSNSADIVEWDVDNIYVYAVCYKPPDFNLKSTGNVVTLSWQRSCTETGFKTPRNVTSELMGYNVYRTNADSLPPYSKLTRTPIPETTYNDSLPLTNGTYCYYVSAVYQDPVNPGVILCKSGSDTLCIHYTGIQEKNESQIRIYPDPVAEVVNIGSDIPFTSIEILDFLGVKVYSKSFSETTHLSVSVTGLPSGNYFLRIQSSKGMIVQKILVDR